MNNVSIVPGTIVKLLLRWAGRLSARKLVYHTSGITVVPPNDRPKSVHNRCVIDVFGGVFMLLL